jgi:hypothetical protein
LNVRAGDKERSARRLKQPLARLWTYVASHLLLSVVELKPGCRDQRSELMDKNIALASPSLLDQFIVAAASFSARLLNDLLTL